MECPGSIRQSEGLPDESSKASREGTFAHTIASQCLNEKKDAKAFIGITDTEFICDATMAGYVQEYVDVVRELAVPGSKVWIEQRVVVNDDIFGSADAIVLPPSRRVLHVADFKYGAGIYVPADDNVQAKCYGLGALNTFNSHMGDVRLVPLHIVQPRHFRGGHEVYDVPVKELFEWERLKLNPAIDAAKAPDAPLRPGSWCKFCRAKNTCPEVKEQAVARVQHLFSDATLSKPLTVPPPAVGMTPAEIVTALKAFPIVEQWIDSVREQAFALAKAGRLPGHKIVTKEGHRKWTDAEAAALVLSVFLPEGTAFDAPKLISPAEAERRLPKDQRALIEKLVTKPVTGETLVADTDARPAISRADVFGVENS